MRAVLVQIDGFDPVTGTAVSLRASSVDDSSVCHLNGATWWPALTKLPVLRYDLFDGAFAGQITAPSSSLTMATEAWPNFGRYQLADARLRLWTGNVGDPWGSYTLRFDGRVSSQPQIKDYSASIDFAVDDRWLDKALLTTYAGTTGAEGPAALKGQVKPLALGAPRYVAGTLIDSINSVFQVSGYGAVNGFETALERLARFNASIGDYASYAALVAATVPAGAWATANAVGMARFGAPPAGQISFLLQGDAAGTDGWARKPGQLIRRLAILSGGTGKIDDASLNALDVARPYNLSLYVDQQTTARDLIQKLAASVNAVAGVSWLGQLFVVPVSIGTPSVTLAADGSALPPVASVQQIAIDPPWQKLALTAERTWQVHQLADIAFTAPLLDLGPYDALKTYREGNIVQQQGVSWLRNSSTASSDAPPTLPTTSNTWWKVLGGAGAQVSSSVIAPASPRINDIWAPPGQPVQVWKDNGGGPLWVPVSTLNADGANMLSSPLLLDRAVLSAGAAVVNTGASGRWADMIRIELSAANAIGAWDLPVPCYPGETLFYEDVVKSDANGTDTCNVSVAYFASDGTALAPVNLSDRSQVTGSFGAWTARKFSFVTPAGAAKVQPYVERKSPSGGTTGKFYAGEAYLGRTQRSADNTLLNQVVATLATELTLNLDSSGALTTSLPTSLTPVVTAGGVDVRTTGGLVYSLTNVSTNIASYLSVNSSTGVVTLASGYPPAAATFYLTITSGSTVIYNLRCDVRMKQATAPVTGGGSGGGSGTKTGSADLSGQGVSSSTFVQWAKFAGLTVATGDKLYVTAYAIIAAAQFGGTGNVKTANTSVKAQYSADGETTWTDVSAAVNGYVASYNTVSGEESDGSFSYAPTAISLSAGTISVRLMVNRTSGNAYGSASEGSVSVQVKP